MTDKIVGGKPAQPGKYPFQVALIASATPEGREKRGQFCGGSLIGVNWVLTAAHCVPRTRPQEVDVYMGSVLLPDGNTSGAPGGLRVSVSKIIAHQRYDDRTHDFDIALLKLRQDAPSSLGLSSLATSDQNAALARDSSPVTVIGWGYTREGAALPAVLMELTVPVQSRASCKANYDRFFEMLPGASPATITDNMFCAGRAEGGADSCQGDSGGFLGAPGSDGRWVQLGIVSWGVGCARPGLFGVYTKVANFGPWIAEAQRNN